ncbi:MAG: type VI secretion system tip protein VgrG [Bacteroidia bacterium]|nr:type VI secretion system tip protein VgrG [Bacteroidia bacterium]
MSTKRSLPTAQPADAPSYRIFSEGTAIPGSFQVASIMVLREVNRISSAELMIYDGDPAQEDFPASHAPEFAPGKKIRIELGYHQDDEPVFEGYVVRQRIQVSGNQSFFKVDCRDKAYKLTLGRNNRYFYEMKDSEIIEQLIRDQGVSADVSSSTVTHAEMVQYNCSDWDFILSRADANGLMVYTDAGTIQVAPPDFFQSAALEVRYGATILDLEAELDGRYQYDDVESAAWDAANQELIKYTANNTAATSPGDLSTADLADDVGIGTLKQYHAGQLIGEELQAWSSAERQRSQMAKVRGRVRIQGFNAINPGDLIDLGGLGERFSGKAFVSGVRHELNQQNWETDVTFGISPESFARAFEDILPLPAGGLLPAVHGLHIGVVTQLENDPEQAHRIRVRVPSIDTQSEGTWARVASLDAGNERGMFFRPEINDEVLIGFLHDDPRNPIVLGHLNSAKLPAPLVATDQNHLKGYVSRAKIKMIFDDDKKSYTLETPGKRILTLDDNGDLFQMEDADGNKITLNPQGITIETSGKLTLKAAQDVEIKGANINIKASAKALVNGAASAEFSASGNTVVKGAVVQIN